MNDSAIDFEKAPLKEANSDNAADWSETMKREFIRIALQQLEAAAAATIPPQQPPPVPKTPSTKILRENVQSAKADLRDVEGKLAEMLKKVGEITTFVRKTVEEALFTVYREKQDENADNAHKQAVDGVQAIKDRLKVEPKLRLSAMRDKIADFTKGFAVTITGALAKLDAIHKLKKATKRHMDFVIYFR